ncbi:putative antitoxin, CopG family [Methanophagales archaeon]|nr:putative antitoxin, CopG family [Methanophagales archaeon]
MEKMGTKIISISEGVYAKLDAERLEGENFDDVITRLTEKKSISLKMSNNSPAYEL